MLILNIISVVLGIIVLLYALYIILEIWRKSDGRIFGNSWLVLIGFISFFVAGYLIFVDYLIFRRGFIDLELVVGQVFLWGAVFAALISKLFQININELFKSKAEGEHLLHDVKFFKSREALQIAAQENLRKLITNSIDGILVIDQSILVTSAISSKKTSESSLPSETISCGSIKIVSPLWDFP